MTVGAVVAAAVVGVGLLWFILSVVTGLIFHFMPGAPIVAAVWVRRSYGPDRPLMWPSLAAHIGVGVTVTAVSLATLAGVGASQDTVWQIAAVMLTGIGIAIWLGRRVTGP
jgi:hypothetical protein